MNPCSVAVSEIVLSVSDLPAMRQFYAEVLGFPLHSEARLVDESEPDESDLPTISFLTIGELDTPLGRNGHPQMLVLIDYRRHVFAKPRFDGLDVRRSSLNHLAFEILLENYDQEFDRLTALKLDPVKTSFENLSARAIFFKDPEGNVIEFICHDPALANM